MKSKNENSDVYVRLDSANAHDAKKQILEMTESVIHLQIISEKMKKLHKEELTGRSFSRKQIKAMISEINQLMTKLPHVKAEKSKSMKEVSIETVKSEVEEVSVRKRTLNQELDDIRHKIEILKK